MLNLPLEMRLLAMVALFEGSAGGKINTWDEQHLSLGTFHFAVGQGPGAELLKRVYQLDPAGTLACLGPAFVAAIKGGTGPIQTFCRVHVARTGLRWAGAFQALWRLDAFKQADREASEPYLRGARALAQRYGLTSERGLAWALDRCVQQGVAPRAYVDRVYASVRGKGEVAVMCALAEAYAATANPKYSGVVRARSLTVAQGDSKGTGYPGRVRLERDFGLRLDVPWRGELPAAPAAPNVGSIPAKPAPKPTAPVPKLFLDDKGGTTVEWNPKAGGAYEGQPLTGAWLSQLALVYPRGTKTKLRTPTGKLIQLEVYKDGAMHLRRV